MRHIPRKTFTLGAAILLAACAAKDDTQAASPSRQIDLAPTKKAEPQLADAPEPKAAPAKAPVKKQAAPPPVQQQKAPEPAPQPAPQPVVPAPAPAPVAAAPAAPPAPTTGTVAVGTSFTVKPTSKICTNTQKPGDRFTATLATPLQGTNGVEVPAGATAVLRIVDESGPNAKADSLHLTYDLLSVRVNNETYEVSAKVTQSAPLERVGSQSTTDKAKKVGAGALIGAIAGRVLGGNTKGAVIGGAVGAAAGAAVAASDQKVNGCLKDDGAIVFALDRPLVIKLAQAP